MDTKIKICSVLECAEKCKARGYCRRHYYSYKQHKDPLFIETIRLGSGIPDVCVANDCYRLGGKPGGMCKYHYEKRRREKKRQYAVQLLGNACAACGGVFEYYEFDHVYRANKNKEISVLIGGNIKKLKEELEKCQLLCKQCHLLKTQTETGDSFYQHGSIKCINDGCKCFMCVTSRRVLNRDAATKWRKKYVKPKT